MIFGITSIFVIISTLISIFFAKKILQNIVGTLNFPTISSYFIFWFFIWIYLGSAALCIYGFHNEIRLNMYNKPNNFLVIWILSVASLYLLLLGMHLANKVLKISPQKKIKEYLASETSPEFDTFLFPLLAGTMIICALIFILYIMQIPEIPILGLFQSKSAIELAKLRSDSNNAFVGKYWFFKLFFKDISLLILIAAFIKRKTNQTWSLFFKIVLGFCIFVAIFDLQKAPIITLMTTLLSTHLFLQKKINWRLIFLTIFSSVMILCSMYFFIMGRSSAGTLIESLLHRAIIGQVHPIYWHIEYAKCYGLLYGKTLPNPHHIFPFEHIVLAKEVMSFAHPELYDLHLVGSMPTIFYAEYLVNFGIIAALLSMLTVGFLIRCVDILILNKVIHNKNIFWLTLYIYHMNYLSTFNTTYISKLLVDEEFIIPTVFLISLALIQNDFKKYAKLLKLKEPTNSTNL